MTSALSPKLLARYFAVLLLGSGLTSALVHPLPNMTDMSGSERLAITTACLLGALCVWFAPWDRWPRSALLAIPPIGLGLKLWANLHGGLGPYSYSIHFVLLNLWIGLALPRGASLGFAPLLVLAYVPPLLLQGDPRQLASVALVVPICVLIGESVAWISSRLREAEATDGERMRRLRWLVEATAQLAEVSRRDQLATLLARLAAALPSSRGALVLLAAADRSFQVVGAENWPGAVPDGLDATREPALQLAMRERVSVSRERPECAELAERLGVPRLGIAPLFVDNTCKGFVLLSRMPGAEEFDPFTRQIVLSLIAQASVAVDRVLARQALLDRSMRDELTGVGNRRAANERLERLAPGDALVVIDLDHFKRVNDTLGHAAGDEVLARLGAHLRRALREVDGVYRLGGEEFLVVLSATGEGAGVAAERLLDGWRASAPATSFSAGVAVHAAGAAPEATLEAADRALYEAKGAGRDRVMEAA